jgi:hypothetical protein
MKGCAEKTPCYKGHDSENPTRHQREKEPGGHDERGMVEADDRMTQAGEKSLHEGARQLVAHEVMRPGELHG